MKTKSECMEKVVAAFRSYVDGHDLASVQAVSAGILGLLTARVGGGEDPFDGIFKRKEVD